MTEPMPRDANAWTTVTAEVIPTAGHRLLLLPFAAPVGPSRGRRYLMWFAHETEPHQRVVLSVGGRAALPAPDGLAAVATQIDLRIRPLQPARGRRLPADLAQALAEAGLRVDAVPETELNQMVLLLNESSTPQVRADRLRAAVTVIRWWDQDCGR